MEPTPPRRDMDDLFLACLQESALGVVVLDHTLCILFWNRWMARASGWEPDSVVGRNLLDVLPELAGTRLLEALESCVGDGLSAILSHKLNHSPLPLHPHAMLPEKPQRMEQMITIKALPMPGGRSILMQVQDVTGAASRERQLRQQTRSLEEQELKLRESEELFRGIIETAPVGLAIFGCEGHRGVLCNTRMREMLHLNAGESFTEVSLGSMLVEPEHLRRFVEVMRQYGRVQEMELHFVTHRQHTFWGLVSARRISMAGTTSVLLGVVDISQRKEMEEKLFTATREAQQASRAKSHFLANMSHEIRTPLNAVIGLSSLAMERCEESNLRDYLEKISFAGRSLLGLLNNLLDFSKIEAGKLELEKIPFLLDDVLNNVGGMFCALAAEKGLEIFLCREPGVPNALLGDPLRLGQVLINLVNNAIKFTHKGEVVVSVRPASYPEESPGAGLLFTVRDTGVGLQQEQLERIFESFEQGDGSITRRYGGSGLGLSICRRLVELMGGSIQVQSEVNRGSVFSFQIRLPVQGEGLGMSEEEAPLGGGASVLLMGDNATSLEVIAHHLRLLAFQPLGPVRTPSDPVFLPSGVAAVIMDWREQTGMETRLAQVRQEVGRISPRARLILLVPFGRDDVRRSCHLHGEDVVCLAKPIQLRQLRSQLLERRDLSLAAVSRMEVQHKLRGARLLLVEDSVINQHVAVEILEHAGMRVSVAGNGREALEILTRERVDAVLMDVQMPVMNGIEATQAIKADARLAHLPVIAMTASALSSDRARCLKAGMVDFITKPIEPVDLYAVLHKWIRLPVEVEPPPEFPGPPEPVQEKGPPLPDYLPGIDLVSVMERMEGNTDLFRRVLALFAQKHAEAPRQIRAAVERGEWEVVRRIAHTLKGSAGSLSAMALCATAHVLEMSVRRNEREAIPVVLSALESALTTVLKTNTMVQGFGGEPRRTEETGTVDVAQINGMLDRLAEHLESNNLDALQCLAPLKQHLRGSPMELDLAQVEQRMGALEFEAALEQLRRMRTAFSQV